MKYVFVGLMLLWGVSTCVADPFNGTTVSGTDEAVTVIAKISPSALDTGDRPVEYIVCGVLLNGDTWCLTPMGWQQRNEGALPAYLVGPPAPVNIPVLQQWDVTTLTGAQIYAGYSDGVVLTYKLIYTVGGILPIGVIADVHDGERRSVATGATYFGRPSSFVVGGTQPFEVYVNGVIVDQKDFYGVAPIDKAYGNMEGLVVRSAFNGRCSQIYPDPKSGFWVRRDAHSSPGFECTEPPQPPSPPEPSPPPEPPPPGGPPPGGPPPAAF